MPKKKILKLLKLAADEMVKSGMPEKEEFRYYNPHLITVRTIKMGEETKEIKTPGGVVTAERPINHYRRIKRLMMRTRCTPLEAVTTYLR